MKNDYGEDVNESQAKIITKRLLKIPDALIDEFFSRCGVVYSRRDYTFKALHHSLLIGLKKNKQGSEAMQTLLSETKIGKSRQLRH